MGETKQILEGQHNNQQKNNEGIVEIDCLTYKKLKGSYFQSKETLAEYLLVQSKHNYNRSKLLTLINKNVGKFRPICGRCYCYANQLKEVREKAKRELTINVELPKYQRPYNLDDIATQYERISTLSGVNTFSKQLFKKIVKDYFEMFWELMLNDYEYDLGYNIGKIYPIRDKYNRVRVDPRKKYKVDNIAYTINKATYYKIYWDKLPKQKVRLNRSLLYYWKFNPPDKVNRKLTELSINDEKGYKVKITPPTFYSGQKRLDDYIERSNKGEIGENYD